MITLDLENMSKRDGRRCLVVLWAAACLEHGIPTDQLRVDHDDDDLTIGTRSNHNEHAIAVIGDANIFDTHFAPTEDHFSNHAVWLDKIVGRIVDRYRRPMEAERDGKYVASILGE